MYICVCSSNEERGSQLESGKACAGFEGGELGKEEKVMQFCFS